MPEEQEEDPGAFVHFNVDNDNYNQDAQGNPIADGTESEAPVTDEDDLCPAVITVLPAGLDVTVVLKRVVQGNGTLQVWSDAEKGSANAIEFDDNSRSWDLTDPDDAAHFAAVHNDLHVEGIDWPAQSGTGAVTLVAELYHNASGALVWSDGVAHTLMAALCGRQPDTSERNASSANYPNLIHCEWSITDDATWDYNCFAWSVGIDDLWIHWWEVDEAGNDNGVLEVEDFDAFYAQHGLSHTGQLAEAVVLLYSSASAQGPWNPQGITHAAVEMPEVCECGAGSWLMFGSKCGSYVRMEHRRDQLKGGYYGEHFRYYTNQ